MPDLDMSPYGVFVWGAYGASALALAAMIVGVWRAARASKRALERLERDR